MPYKACKGRYLTEITFLLHRRRRREVRGVLPLGKNAQNRAENDRFLCVFEIMSGHKSQKPIENHDENGVYHTRIRAGDGHRGAAGRLRRTDVTGPRNQRGEIP